MKECREEKKESVHRQIYVSKEQTNDFYLTQDGDVPKKKSVVIRKIIENQLLIQLCEISKFFMYTLKYQSGSSFNYSQKVSLDILY